MKTLLLLRHAKAETGGKETKDHERVLTARGRANAAAMGAYLHIHGYMPDVVLCSAAARTVETWAILAAELDETPRVELLEQLYLASSRRIQSLVREAGDVETVLVIGHNSGMEECAAELARVPADKDEGRRRETMREKYPTCTLAVMEFEGAWETMAVGTGALVEFVRPKDLP
jgi:phosphohistidine phosphatase